MRPPEGGRCESEKSSRTPPFCSSKEEAPGYESTGGSRSLVGHGAASLGMTTKAPRAPPVRSHYARGGRRAVWVLPVRARVAAFIEYSATSAAPKRVSSLSPSIG